MDQQFKDRISWWHLRVKKEKDHWIRFILYYFIFDAYLGENSGKSNNTKKLKWFLNNPNPLKDSFSDIWDNKLLPEVKVLKSFSPIKDMRPNFNEKVALNDENNLKEIFQFIYQIRCNLFHGAKDRMDDKDSSLVESAGNFLRYSIDWWLI